MQKNTLAAISSLGVSEKAARIYLASLSLGTCSLQSLAEKAEVKRPTAYLHIDELINAGLMVKVPYGKKELFEPVEPAVLEELARKNLSSIQGVVKSLENLQVSQAGRPKVGIYEGRKGIEKIYREIQKTDSLRFWSNLASFESEFQREFEEISIAISKNQIRAREIIPDTIEARRSSKKYALLAGKNYSCRIAVKAGITNDSAIYGNTMALFRIQEYNLYVIKITDAQIVNSMSVIFDMAWSKAKVFIN